MEKKTQYRLKDISACCSIEYASLVKLLKDKVINYHLRDLKINKKANESERENRALDVIQEYMIRKHNYTESWIE